MLLKIVYLLTRRLLCLAVLLFRRGMAKDAELLVVRRAGTAAPAPALDRYLSRHARDAAGLAAQAGSAQVRHEQ